VRKKYRVSVRNLPIMHRHVVGNHRLYFGSRTVLGTGQLGERGRKASFARLPAQSSPQIA